MTSLENQDDQDEEREVDLEQELFGNKFSKRKFSHENDSESSSERTKLESVDFERFEFSHRQPGYGLKDMIFGTKLNILMLLSPIALISSYLGMNSGIVFFINLLALAPFAERLGFITEQLALYTNNTIGGFLNATFGNVTELLLSLFALVRGRRNVVYRRLVQVSLLGSVFSNLLLVLGSSLLLGGLSFPTQKFNRISATTQLSLLFLACLCYALPTLQNIEKDTNAIDVIGFSRFESILMLLVYLLFLIFQLVTHSSLLEEDDDEDERPVVLFKACLIWLFIITIIISVMSENIVDAIEGTVRSWNISEVFIGSIIIPIVGNAAEHASALIFASKNKLDIAISVAVGSAVQISIMAFPFCVLLGWTISSPLSLAISPYDLMSLCLSVFLVAITLKEGISHYLSGLILLIAYMIIAAGYYDQKSEI